MKTATFCSSNCFKPKMRKKIFKIILFFSLVSMASTLPQVSTVAKRQLIAEELTKRQPIPEQLTKRQPIAEQLTKHHAANSRAAH